MVSDITERKQAEEALRIAATAFESQQGMVITDAQRMILRVNQAFTSITNYSDKEAVGQYPRMLKSGRHDSAFYAAMTQALEQDGTWAGEIWNRRKNGEIYPEWLSISAVKDADGLTSHFVAIFSDISERINALAQIDTLAFYDPLTQLPNRRLLLDRLEQALHASTRHARNSALLFVDLDNFKTLNDTLGHHQGDLLLAQVALRLKTCIREGDTVARLGSDEFVVMLENLSEDDIDAATQAETVADNILNAFQQDFWLDQGSHHATPSIGITLFGGDSLQSSEQPLRHAELAMFQAKAAGRNTLRFFDARMQAEVSAHAALEADLREAVQQQQFLLHYQPQVVGAGRITGVEALVRWQHPQRGMVSPAEFIPLAEESGLILPIGQWVLETACAQLTAWAQQPELAHLTVAVNVSARQFKQEDFVDSVLATLARTQANPKRLKLELTESMLIDDVEAIIAKMGLLKAHGVAFSLDDFGTGYSSLAYLKRLPLDQLKIDQGFVRNIVTDPNDAVIARMVVLLAESMGLSVIAEGVELQAQADFLAHQGCHAYQGYLFSRPLPLAALEAFARSH
ncbi:MAG: EAL domain-containing protein [Comamonadaceae bacterium]|nr:EAL domain-containing protein [Comamonadaceae bacterium]